MEKIKKYSNKSILGIFAHPDDETSGAGCTISKYAELGADVSVITATRGELGTLGTGNLTISREELPSVREDEFKRVMSIYGANPPIFLDYKDQEVNLHRTEDIADKILLFMKDLMPDVIITFGPQGISKHSDHIAIHKAALHAFSLYKELELKNPSLLYVAIPKEVAAEFELKLSGPETEPNIFVPANDHIDLKIKALRTYKSQEDAQEFAAWLESIDEYYESFKLIHPKLHQPITFDDLLSKT